MKDILYIIAGGLVFVVLFFAMRTEDAVLNIQHISSFDECVAAGNPVMESFPEQCKDIKSGQTFVNKNQQNQINNDFSDEEQVNEDTVIENIFEETDSVTETFIIASTTETCTGLIQQECLIVNGELFYDEINGFNYEAGFEYEIMVERFPVENVPADGSSYRYVLVEILSKTQSN